MSRTFGFTRRAIDELPPSPTRSLSIYWDEKEEGLGLYVTQTGHKSYFIRKKIKGVDRRIVIGSADEITPDQARETFRHMKEMVKLGIDPFLKQQREKKGKLTLGDLYEQYLERYSKVHKKSWRHDESEIKAFLGHWFKLRIDDIKRNDIRLLHEKLFKEKGPYRANRMLERIKAMYNKAIEWDWEGINPAIGIRAYPEKSRDRFVQQDEMPYLVQAIESELNPTVRDFLWMLLLTGARRTNVAMMRWEDINWKGQYWRIPDTKNGDPLNVPLIEKALSILQQRRKEAPSVWVFPSDVDNAKHFVNFKRAKTRVLKKATLLLWSQDERVARIVENLKQEIEDESYINLLFKSVQDKAKVLGIPLTTGLMDIRLHDLRRTLGSYQAINGTSLHVIGQSLGHKSLKATQIYARLTLDPVRESVSKAVDSMFNSN